MAVTYVYTGLAGTYTFNFSTQIISCQNTIDNVTIQELTNACREAENSTTGIAFPKICNASGKDYLDVNIGVQLSITIVLLDGWLIYSTKSSGVFKVYGGNLVQVSGGDPFLPNPLVTEVNILSAAGTVVTVSSGSGLSTEEHNRLMALPQTTFDETDRQTLDGIGTAIEGIESGKLSTEDFKKYLLNRVNTIVDKKITQYRAGGDAVVNVTYDGDGIPSSEGLQP
jgi:hypothetical protein